MSRAKKSLKDYTALGSISAKLILKNLPFVLFLFFLATIYIANAHYAEKQVRTIQSMQKEVKDLRREYNALKAEMMFKSKETEVAEGVEKLGLRRPSRSPKKIVVE